MILPVLISFVIVNVLGFLWYSKNSPFGKTWMNIIGMSESMPKPTKKQMAGMFGLQFLTSLIQIFSINFLLALLIPLNLLTTVICSVAIFVGFIMPIVAGNALWSGKSCKMSWKMFGISAGYQLVSALIIALVFWFAR